MSTDYMVDTQIKPRGVSDRSVLRAMRAVSRDLFVPDAYRNLAFSDCPLPIPKGQTISQPYMVAAMTEMLQVGPTSRVLEIGTGSGYQTAVLAEIVERVYTVEILEPLGASARTLLENLGYENIAYRIDDGFYGWQEEAPYDGIIVTAAPDRVPPPLIDQLAIGGRLIIPVGPHSESQSLRVITRDAHGEIASREVMPVRFVPLTGDHDN